MKINWVSVPTKFSGSVQEGLTAHGNTLWVQINEKWYEVIDYDTITEAKRAIKNGGLKIKDSSGCIKTYSILSD